MSTRLADRAAKRHFAFMAARRRFRWGFVALGVVAVALVLWVILHKPAAKKPTPPATPVTAVKATVQDVPVSITALGAAQAWQSDAILAQVSGTLLSVAFKEGTQVTKGQLLAQIDPAPYRAALTQAQGALIRDQALLAEARLDLARYQTLSAQDSIARQQVDTQAALVKQDEGIVLMDKGAVAAARVNLDRCSIRAPVSGRTGVRLVDPGNLVSASGSAVATASGGGVTGASGASASSSSSGGAASSSASPSGIVIVNQIQPIAVTFTVPQGDFQHLTDLTDGFRKPLAAEALSQETGASLGTGTLSIADNRVDPSTGTVQLKAKFDNPGERLWPGQFVNVRLTLQTLSRVTTIPSSAVNQGPNGAFAYVIGADGKVAAQPIKVAWTQGATAVIASGVTAGQSVVTDGQLTLKPGAHVKIKAAATPKARS